MAHGHSIFATFYRWFGGLAARAGFADERRRLPAEARRVLKPGGRLPPQPDTLAAVVAAGLDTGAVEPVTLPGMRLTRPGIAGVARKPVG